MLRVTHFRNFSTGSAVIVLGAVVLFALGACGSPPASSSAPTADARPAGSGSGAGAELPYRVVSYNIRHGRGMDGEIDLQRIAGVLDRLEPDLIGLQEVDSRATRSGEVDQAAELGRLLEMHAAFGAFMPFQGGEYGMAILSRHPLRSVNPVRLPGGNEPRIALAVEVMLPGGETIMAVNVHFDWVRDDGFRFAQASALAEWLRELEMPYVLLGDFNDQPGSRTLDLFHALAGEAAKPTEERFTFPSVEPDREIDFIFAAPRTRWRIGEARVIDEQVASDHRPVVAELVLRPGDDTSREDRARDD